MKSAQIDAADFDSALRKLRHAEIANAQATATAAMAAAAAVTAAQDAARMAPDDVPFWRVAGDAALAGAGGLGAALPSKQSRVRRSGKLSASESRSRVV